MESQAPEAAPTADPHAAMWKEQADNDLKVGKIDAATHAGIMGELGFNQQAPAQAAPDEVGAYLAAEGFAPAKPSELRLRQHLPENMTPELRKAEESITGWITEARLPSGIANAIVADIAKSGDKWQTMDDTQREIHAQQTRTQLEKLWGDKAPERIALAQRLIRELDARRPGLIRFLDESGAGNSTFLIAQLGMHAERLAARHERKQ
jgi:hypothetical protein